MEKKFIVGDKVTYLPDDMQGEITAVHSRGLYGVKYPDEDDSFTVNEADLEFADPKTAFLSELKELLIKHNADIWVDSIGFDDNFLRIDINGAEKQSFKVGNSVILHDEEIKIEPLESNWY